MIVQIKHLMIHKWYSTEIVINGFATITIYGPFHRHRANLILDECKLKVINMLIDEQPKCSKNVVVI